MDKFWELMAKVFTYPGNITAVLVMTTITCIAVIINAMVTFSLKHP